MGIGYWELGIRILGFGLYKTYIFVMIYFETTINKYKENVEKTSWTFIEISSEIATILKPNYKRSFRVKGLLNKVVLNATAIIPIGNGIFVLPLNITIRKQLKMPVGETINVALEIEEKEYELNVDFVDCLLDVPSANNYFKTLTKSHQKYFSKWIESAKTTETKSNRIVRAINALSKKLGYSEMVKIKKED